MLIYDQSPTPVLWTLVGISIAGVFILIWQSIYHFTKLRFVCMLAGLASLCLLFINTLRIYISINLDAYVYLYYIFDMVYIDLIATIFLTLGIHLRISHSNPRATLFYITTILGVLFTLLVIAVIISLHFISEENGDVLFPIILVFGVVVNFSSAIYTFLPLFRAVRRRKEDESVDPYSVGAWYFICICLINIVYILFVIDVGLRGLEFSALSQSADLLCRIVALVIYALPPPRGVLRLMARYIFRPNHIDSIQPYIIDGCADTIGTWNANYRPGMTPRRIEMCVPSSNTEVDDSEAEEQQEANRLREREVQISMSQLPPPPRPMSPKVKGPIKSIVDDDYY